MHGGTDETGDTSWWDLLLENLHMNKNIFDGLIDKYNAFTDTPTTDVEFLKVMIQFTNIPSLISATKRPCTSPSANRHQNTPRWS